jgi:hypothetical protein
MITLKIIKPEKAAIAMTKEAENHGVKPKLLTVRFYSVFQGHGSSFSHRISASMVSGKRVKSALASFPAREWTLSLLDLTFDKVTSSLRPGLLPTP